jgi:hypothetical protein
MTVRGWIESPRTRLDIVAGLIDGILNALTLAAGHLMNAGGADLGLAMRVGIATGLTTLFVFFMAHYAELRAELVRAERELSITAHGRLAASRLGQRAVQASAAGATLAAACGVCGASFSLLLCSYLPGPRWTGLAATVALLGGLGALLAKSFHGSPVFWALMLVVGGALLTIIGVKIDIAG